MQTGIKIHTKVILCRPLPRSAIKLVICFTASPDSLSLESMVQTWPMQSHIRKYASPLLSQIFWLTLTESLNQRSVPPAPVEVSGEDWKDPRKEQKAAVILNQNAGISSANFRVQQTTIADLLQDLNSWIYLTMSCRRFPISKKRNGVMVN